MRATEAGPIQLQDLANLSQLIGLPLAVAALGLAWWQLRKTAKITKAQFLLSLDDAFARHEDIRKLIVRPDWDIDASTSVDQKNRVRRYIAVFERLGLLLQDHTLDWSTVEHVYGAQFRRLLLKDGVRSTLLEVNPQAWRGVIYFWRQMSRRDPELPRPPRE